MQNKKNDFFSGAKGAVNYLLFCLIVVAFVLLCVCHTGCQITIEGIKVLGAEESPVLNSVNVIDEKTMEAHFSKQVVAECAYISKLGAEEKISIDCIAEGSIAVQSASADDGTTVVYTFPTGTQIGERYQLYSEVKDSRGNSLTFAMPFEGYNNRIPIIILEEIGSPQGNKTEKKITVAKRCEYIMLRALSAGNLGGIELFSAQYEKLSKYRFPAIEVKEGEYITVHLRTYDGQGYTEELGENLALDKNEGSKNHIRDLYFVNGEKCANEKCDVILLRNRANMEILDCVAYTTEAEKNKYEKYSETAALAASLNKWLSNTDETSPIILEKALTTTGICLKRKNSDALLALAKKGSLSQEAIIPSKNDWKTYLPIYSASRK